MLPTEWTERIFTRLESVFKNRWLDLYGNPKTKSLYITQWSTGLSGLTASEIQKALALCQAYPYADVPNVVEFYHFAKGIKVPAGRKKPEITPVNREIQQQHMKKIRQNLNMRSSM